MVLALRQSSAHREKTLLFMLLFKPGARRRREQVTVIRWALLPVFGLHQKSHFWREQREVIHRGDSLLLFVLTFAGWMPSRKAGRKRP
jgi:hypothetical protein